MRTSLAGSATPGKRALAVAVTDPSPGRLYYLKCAVLLYLGWIVTFQLVGRFAARLPTYDLTIGLDRHIPFLPEFVWPYELCYLLPFVPILVTVDWHRFNRVVLATLLANVTAFAVYLFVPCAFVHPALRDSLAERVVGLEYASDFHPGANHLPSMHVAIAWLAYLACRGQRLGRLGESAVFGAALLVTASTLFVKQHVLLDVVTGVFWAAGAWFVANRLYSRLYASDGEAAPVLARLLRRGGLASLAAVALLLALRLAASLALRGLA